MSQPRGLYINQNTHTLTGPIIRARSAPQEIKHALDYVNQFSSNVGAKSDDGGLACNYVQEDLGLVNGECQDLGVHNLGLFKDTKVVTEMNNAGYGIATGNGLPV